MWSQRPKFKHEIIKSTEGTIKTWNDWISDINISMQLQSNIAHPMVIRDRNGLTYMLQPKTTGSHMQNDVSILMVYRLKKHVKSDMDLKCIEGSPELQLIYQGFLQEPMAENFHGYHTVTVKYTYSYEFIMENNGSIYVPGADLVISLLSVADTPRHPYDPVSLRDTLVSNLRADYKGVCLRGIRLIDSENRVGILYTNINGEIYRIIPEDYGEDLISPIEDGLYILGSEPVSKSNSRSRPRSSDPRKEDEKHYRNEKITIEKLLSNLSEYNLYRTIPEARCMGNKILESTQNALNASLTKAGRLEEELSQLKYNTNSDISHLKNQIEYLKRHNKSTFLERVWDKSLSSVKLLPIVIPMIKILKPA